MQARAAVFAACVLTMTSREFNQSASEAKKASLNGPVFITDRGKPSHVLLSIEEYRKLAGGMTTLADALAQHGDSPRAALRNRPLCPFGMRRVAWKDRT
jgi:prevent-host-death family protein